jgi:hypothetical protein
MKTIKLTSLLIIALLLNSCGFICFYNDPAFQHNLHLSFTDTAGNNLVAGIEFDERGHTVDPALYTLRIIFDNPADEFNLNNPLLTTNPNLIGVRSGRYLTFFILSRMQDGNACRQRAQTREITLKLTFPQLFGDNKEREIVTYWRRGRTTRSRVPFPAYRVVFEGKEVEVRHEWDGAVSIANIVVD